MNVKPSNDMSQIGLNIAYYRKKKGMKQKELAEILDISNNYMSQIETCKKTPAVALIYDIADILEIEAYKLFEAH